MLLPLDAIFTWLHKSFTNKILFALSYDAPPHMWWNAVVTYVDSAYLYHRALIFIDRDTKESDFNEMLFMTHRSWGGCEALVMMMHYVLHLFIFIY